VQIVTYRLKKIELTNFRVRAVDVQVIPNLLFERTKLGSTDRLVVPLHRRFTALAHKLPPTEEEVWLNAVFAGQAGDAHPAATSLIRSVCSAFG